MRYSIGIDVGGTNTDAVIMDQNHCLRAKAKSPTTPDVITGIRDVVNILLAQCKIDYKKITYAMLGTTQCTNAILERKNLNRAAVIRIGKPATEAIEPMTGWPRDLKEAIGKYSFIVSGGHEFDGREISAVNPREILSIARTVKGNVEAIAITSVFSPLNPGHEKRVAGILRQELGEKTAISLSGEIGGIGLLERENTTILNAALLDTARKVVGAFGKVLTERGIHPVLFMSQNDGTLMSVKYALSYPIFTIACGPTNSISGAAFLSGLENAVVIDVGGTTTDIGLLRDKFPAESSGHVEIGGVRTNFRMPDIVSVGIGGGTIIRRQGNLISIGPQSTGYRLQEKALVFGGDTLTISDIAVAMGRTKMGNPAFVKTLEPGFVRESYAGIVDKIEVAVDKVKTAPGPIPVVSVGGGSVILPETLKGAAAVYHPEHYEVANAIGAAIARVSGQVERIAVLDQTGREQTLAGAVELAKAEAVKAGANPETLSVVDIEEIPMAYLPGNAVKIRVKAAGDLQK